MATLQLNSLTCVNPQEDGPFDRDGDEVYFMFHDNGGTTGSVTTDIIRDMHGDTQKDLTDVFHFSGSVEISLTEDDGRGGFADDHLVTQDIEAHPVTSVDLRFVTEGVEYILNYDVIA